MVTPSVTVHRDRQSEKLVVMIPAYNEEDLIGDVIEAIPRNIEGISEVEVLVVDGGSSDNTVKVARDKGADFILSSRRREGLAHGFKRGLDQALLMGADVIVNIDADNQYDPAEIASLVGPVLSGQADMVMGSRFLGRIDFMPRGNRVGNRLATWVTSQLAGLKITDAQTGFRAFSKEAALRLNITSDYTYTQETIIQAAHKDLKIIEVPCTFRERQGPSRLISSLPRYALRAGVSIIRTYRDYHPLRTFALLGVALILVGSFFAFRVAVNYLETGFVTPLLPSLVISVLLLIGGFQAIILALLADMLRTNRNIQDDIILKLKRLEIARNPAREPAE